jgi:hypothetical protein
MEYTYLMLNVIWRFALQRKISFCISFPECVRFASKIIFLLIRFENNFLTVGCVHFDSKIIFLLYSNICLFLPVRPEFARH